MSSEKNGCKRNVHMNVIYFSGFMVSDLYLVTEIIPLNAFTACECEESRTLVINLVIYSDAPGKFIVRIYRTY